MNPYLMSSRIFSGKLFTLYILSIATCGVFAAEPLTIRDFDCMRLSSQGNYLAGKVLSTGNYAVYDRSGNLMGMYTDVAAGEGNFIAENGISVGNSIKGKYPVVMEAGDLKPLYGFTNEGGKAEYKGTVNAISDDGSLICGVLTASPEGVTFPIGFVLYPERNMEEQLPSILPYPEKDLFMTVPKSVTAELINKDGTIIAGRVVSGTGDYTYPIVYFLEEGKWNYILPLSDLFNPENLDIPVKPE